MTRRDPVRFVYYLPAPQTGLRVVYMYDQGYYDVGTMVWRVCDACRIGIINKISVSTEWQRHGYGRRLIRRALRDGAGYRWLTTHQSPDGRKLIDAISAETGITFNPPGQRVCEHVDSRRDLSSHRPKPVIDRSI